MNYSTLLDEKDMMIDRLRHQIQDQTTVMRQFEELMLRKSEIEAAVAKLENEYDQQVAKNKQQNTSNEKIVGSLRGEKECLARENKSLVLKLNDLLTEADGLATFYNIRNEQLQHESENTEEIEQFSKEISEELRKLKTIQNQLIESLTISRQEQSKVANNHGISLSNLHSANLIKQEKALTQQRLSNMLRQYEEDNVVVERQVEQLENLQSQLDENVKLREEQIKNFENDHKQLELKIQKLRTQNGLKAYEFQQMKARLVEGAQVQRSMVQDINRVQSRIHEQNEESNFLINRNGEICQVNRQLKSDLQLCLKHFESIRRGNRDLTESVQKFRTQDENIVKGIQHRGKSSEIRKLEASRATSAKHGSSLANTATIF